MSLWRKKNLGKESHLSAILNAFPSPRYSNKKCKKRSLRSLLFSLNIKPAARRREERIKNKFALHFAIVRDLSSQRETQYFISTIDLLSGDLCHEENDFSFC